MLPMLQNIANQKNHSYENINEFLIKHFKTPHTLVCKPHTPTRKPHTYSIGDTPGPSPLFPLYPMIPFPLYPRIAIS